MAGKDGGFKLDYKRILLSLHVKKAAWIIVIAGIIVYFNGLFGAFIGDDKSQILNNPIVQSLSNIPQILTGSMSVSNSGAFLAGPYYRPLYFLLYAALYALFNATPFYFHAFQLLLHIVDGILIFILFKKFLKEHIALLLSLLFIVHPINSEAVVYIADLQEPLFLCFGLSALLLSMKETISPKRAVLVGFLLLCSLLTKETGILFVFIVILSRLFIRWRKRDLLKSFVYAIPPVLIYMFLRFEVAKMYILHTITDMPITLLPLSQRVLTMPAIAFYYLKTFFFPASLDFYQTWVVKSITLSDFFIPLLANGLFLAAVIFFGIYLYRRQSTLLVPYIFFALWFLIGVGFHMQLLPLDWTVSERWFYFPIVGLLGMIGVTIQSFSGKLHSNQNLAKTLGAIAVLILILLSVRTIVRNADWTNEITLYTHDLAINDSSLLENNLGNDYLTERNFGQAILHYKRSASIDPTLVGYYNIALSYMNEGDLFNAKIYYLKALAADKTPRDHQDFTLVGDTIYQNLTFIYIISHAYSTAEQLASKALDTYPHDGRLWENLAVSQYMRGESDLAIKAVTNSQSYLPNDTEAQYVYRQITSGQPLQIGK